MKIIGFTYRKVGVMTLRKLKIYYTVAEKLNMTEAAKELYISQPSISQAIRELEERLGVKLLERMGKKLHLTEEGRVFRGYAVRMLNLYEESVRVMEDMRELRKGRIRVGASTTIGTYLLPDIVADFKRRYPGVDVELFIDNTEIISNKLLRNKLDIAYVEGPVRVDEILSQEVWRDEMVFISPESYGWADIISPEELDDVPFIMRERGSGSRETYEAAMGVPREGMGFTFGNTEAIKRGVRKGMGASCVSRLAVEEEIARGEFRVSRMKGRTIERGLNLIYHKDKVFGGLIEVFLEFARNYKS